MAGPLCPDKNARSLARRKGEKGFTLLELMIAMAVSTIVIGTISITMIGATRSVLAVRQDSLTSSFMSQLSSIFRDPDLCAAAFKSAPLGVLGTPIDVNPAAFPVTVPRIEFCPTGTCVLADAVLAEQNKRTGGEIAGVLIARTGGGPPMTLDNPSLVAGSRYRWTLKIYTQKADAQGLPLPNSERVHNFRLTISTRDGSPDYRVTSCGIETLDPLSVAPPSILMTRSTIGVDTITEAIADTECNRIGSDYTAATLPDLSQLQAATGTTGGAIDSTNPQYFGVYHDTGRAFALDHPPGIGNGLQINFFSGVRPVQIACVHRTAPLRFTRTATHQPSDGPAVRNLDCDKAFGPSYVGATFSDLFQYGFVEVPAGTLNALQFTEITIGGVSGNNICRVAFHPTIGLAMDCSHGDNQRRLACVTRAN